MFEFFDIQLLTSGIRLSVPLIIAAMGGMFSERGGVVNIALDGIMIFGCAYCRHGCLSDCQPMVRNDCRCDCRRTCSAYSRHCEQSQQNRCPVTIIPIRHQSKCRQKKGPAFRREQIRQNKEVSNLTGEDDSNLMSDMDFETEDMTKQIDTDPLIVHLQGIVFTLIYFGGMFGAIYTAARLRMYRSISNELLIVLYALWPLLFIVWGGLMIYRRRRPA
ncbi:hypothetical protein CHS0354_030073 [Potamilus streckersoni]|uniref:ABC transporter permease n=1 Tax=Potamilus streckersoni TaxID=2493646 RepID=A0AAE0RL07_9BIVA|nr:hypothetical protein CHS0354_030073 [Potamilus streckersoni]